MGFRKSSTKIKYLYSKNHFNNSFVKLHIKYLIAFLLAEPSAIYLMKKIWIEKTDSQQ